MEKLQTRSCDKTKGKRKTEKAKMGKENATELCHQKERAI